MMRDFIDSYMEDIAEEENRLLRALDPTVNYKKLVKAKKSHTCEMCGCEIHKNEYHWFYKPNPTYNADGTKHYYKWRKRCRDCEPMYHSEMLQIENKGMIGYGGYND